MPWKARRQNRCRKSQSNSHPPRCLHTDKRDIQLLCWDRGRVRDSCSRRIAQCERSRWCKGWRPRTSSRFGCTTPDIRASCRLQEGSPGCNQRSHQDSPSEVRPYPRGSRTRFKSEIERNRGVVAINRFRPNRLTKRWSAAEFPPSPRATINPNGATKVEAIVEIAIDTVEGGVAAVPVCGVPPHHTPTGRQ